MTERTHLQRQLSEQLGNLRAAITMLGISGVLFVLSGTTVFGLALLPWAVCGGVFGLTWALAFGISAAQLHRRIRASMPPAARVIARPATAR